MTNNIVKKIGEAAGILAKEVDTPTIQEQLVNKFNEKFNLMPMRVAKVKESISSDNSAFTAFTEQYCRKNNINYSICRIQHTYGINRTEDLILILE